jgi:hypothetical protein
MTIEPEKPHGGTEILEEGLRKHVDLVLSLFKNIVAHESYEVTGAFLAEF